ncbi:MAG TPA: DUF167 domain-containing protein [bacterium]|nr:DUF167 domain-containing protein [bacterium]HPP30656.1 DUF167 domain-containing protein [bacterium]
MKIVVKVVANARKPGVSEEGDIIKVRVDAPAVEGKANKRLVEILSEYYHKPRTAFIIKSGLKSKKKIIEIL